MRLVAIALFAACILAAAVQEPVVIPIAMGVFAVCMGGLWLLERITGIRP